MIVIFSKLSQIPHQLKVLLSTSVLPRQKLSVSQPLTSKQRFIHTNKETICLRRPLPRSFTYAAVGKVK